MDPVQMLKFRQQLEALWQSKGGAPGQWRRDGATDINGPAAIWAEVISVAELPSSRECLRDTCGVLWVRKDVQPMQVLLIADGLDAYRCLYRNLPAVQQGFLAVLGGQPQLFVNFVHELKAPAWR
jgi:hypothetical protein